MRFSGYLLAVMALLSFAVMGQTQRGRSTNQRSLTGIDWQLVSLGPVGAEKRVIAGTTVTLKFGEEGRASGSTGCNSYGGTYQVRGDNISFSRIASTRRACLDQNANEQEHKFLSIIETANRFRLATNRLAIVSDRGRSVLNFVNSAAFEPQDGPEVSQLNFRITKEDMHDAQGYRDYDSHGVDIFDCLPRSGRRHIEGNNR